MAGIKGFTKVAFEGKKDKAFSKSKVTT